MTPAPRGPIGSMGQFEFIALMAMMAATVAFSIDAMLPALGEIGRDLDPSAPDNASLVVTVFVAGMGLGTLFAGPLSDAFGRKPVMLVGALIYALAALAASVAQSLEALLVARFVQGLGAAGPRVVTLAVVRDLFGGRDMARLVSFIMVVFTLVPVLAPSMGAGIIVLAGWRGIFVSFVVFAALTGLWMAMRLPETLSAGDKRPFRLVPIWHGMREMWGIEMVRLSILTQTLTFGVLFSILSTTQLIFDQTFGRAESFHLWFGAIALVAGTSGFLNARIVRRFGMRPIIMVMLAISALGSLIYAAFWVLPLGHETRFWGFVAWQTLLFFKAGMTIGNLNALAMEPLGHMAGLGASVMGALSTLGAALLAMPVVTLFDRSPLPVALVLAAMAALGFAISLRMRQLERVGTPAT